MAIVASGQITLVDMNDSKQLVSYIGSSQPKTVIFNPNGSTYTPNYASTSPNTNQVLTPQLFIAGTSEDKAGATKSTKWFVQENGSGTITEITANTGDYTLGTGSVKTLTIKSNVLATRNSMTYICEMVYTDPDTGFDVVAKSEIELVKISNGTAGSNGTNAITAVLSNDSDTVPSDSAGSNQIITGVTTTVTVYEGATDVTSLWSMGTPVVTGLGALNTAYTLTGTPANRIFTLTGTNPMTADVATVTWTLTRSGYANIVKAFTISRIKGGANGSNGTTPTLYRLIPSANAIAKNTSGAYNPTSFTVTGKSQTGNGTYGDYAGKFIIAESTDGTNFTDKYTTATATNEATKAWTPTAGIKSIRVRMYLAGTVAPVPANFLDEQIIPVVSDGTNGNNGTNAVLATVWTPDGNTLKNSVGTLSAQADIYSGTTKITTGLTYKWYALDPTATVASGGDSDGGAGWRLIKDVASANGVTGYTSEKITIPASAINSVASFKAIVTYNSVKYQDVTTVIDVTDPIVVSVIGVNTFKNGEGSTSLTARVYRNGAEIDTAGTAYTYSWSLYKSDGTLDGTFGTRTGKTVTVLADEVDIRANLVCSVSN